MEGFLDRIARLPHRKLALLAAELYERSAAASGVAEPIAITGMACRVPGADTPDGFWSFLDKGGDAIGPIPQDRLAMTGTTAAEIDGRGANWGGFLKDVAAFDAGVFGISQSEAESMDPQQRLLLEVCWEALENAGTPIDALDSGTGVFMGISGIDYALLNHGAEGDPNGYVVTGFANSVAAGRISYVLGLNGPSTVVDTACSASASAIHLACQSLRARECEQAIAGGVNLLLLPQITQTISGLQGFARDGRCKAFSAAADGFVRSEGCGVIVLRRLSEATFRGEPILGVIRGSAWNQDGRSGGLTAPNGLAQEQVIRAALANAKLSPDQVSYVEAHGTGTPLGDPIEISALGRVFGGESRRERPLAIGSVKTNIGHLEAAAGVAGVMKVLLALRHGKIPPHLHATTLNPRIDWPNLPFVIPGEGMPWPSGPEPRIAGVSSFGFSGTNVHLVIGEPPPQAEPERLHGRSSTVLTLSAKSRPALLALAARYAEALSQRPGTGIAAFAASANQKRAHFAHRLALPVADASEAAIELRRFAQADAGSRVRAAFVVQHRPPRIGLMFGDAPPDPALVARLNEAEPAFRSAYQSWLASQAARDRLPRASACIGFQFALAELWRAWGISPSLCCGEGAGEIAAALIADGLTVQEAAALAARIDGDGPAPERAPDKRLKTNLLTGSLPGDAETGHSLPADVMERIGTSSASPPLRERAQALADRLIAMLPDTYDAVLGELASVYLAGAPIDWRGFHSGERPDPALLPNYPFQRSRYWPAALSRPDERRRGAPETEASGPVPDEGLYRVEWRPTAPGFAADGSAPAEVIAALRPRLVELDAEQDYEDVSDAQRDLNDFAVLSICEALRQLRPGIGPGTVLPADPGEALGVVPVQRRMLRSIFAFIETCGLIERRPNGWAVVRDLPRADLAAEIERLRRDHPRFKVETDIAARAIQLPDVLRGDVSGVDVLFPDGSFALLDALYRDSMAARIMNRLVGETVAALARSAAGPLRVLEIGAGTGSTTAAVLPRLPKNTEYTFTDVSPAFLVPARASFAQHPVRFEVLDIESATDVRALAAHPFDLILAANVLHATRSLGETLGHVRTLLRPGGALVLLEGTETLPITDVTLGMLEGWWRHEDGERQSSSPLLNRDQWCRVLDEAGFDAECLPADPSFGGVTQQQTIVIARLRAERPAGDRPIASVTILHRNPAAAAAARDALHTAGVAVQDMPLASIVQPGRALAAPPSPRRDAAWLYLPAREPVGETPVEAAASGFEDLRIIAQAVLESGDAAAALYVATCGAQPANSAIRPAEAALWSAGRVLASEASGARVSFVDLDAEAPDWASLARIIASGRAEPELAVVAGRVLAPSLAPARLAAAPAAPAASRDASYIVTGAFGVLGAYAAGWLAEQGAGKLFLVGRNPPGPQALAAIEAARLVGAEVETVVADVGDAQGVQALFARVEADPRPLRGIIHAAASLDDAPISRQSPARFARAFGPKAEGAWLLHEGSRRHRLDFFVLYSSVAALIGSAGQSNYAAANGFIDALAHHRRALGLPAVSINWGLWSSTGAAIRREVVETGTLQGAIPITPEQGHAALARALASDEPQLAVLPLDWGLLRRALGARRPPTLLQPLLASSPDDPMAETPAPGGLLSEHARLLAGAAAPERLALLTGFIRKRLAELLNLDPATAIEDDRPLLDLGLDSLVGLELRNDVQTLSGMTLPSTLFFDYPTLGDLARYLQVVLPAEQPARAAHPPAELEQMLL